MSLAKCYLMHFENRGNRKRIWQHCNDIWHVQLVNCIRSLKDQGKIYILVYYLLQSSPPGFSTSEWSITGTTFNCEEFNVFNSVPHVLQLMLLYRLSTIVNSPLNLCLLWRNNIWVNISSYAPLLYATRLPML